MAAVADIGVIGGSGFYEFLTDPEEVKVTTPFGEPAVQPVRAVATPARGITWLPPRLPLAVGWLEC